MARLANELLAVAPEHTLAVRVDLWRDHYDSETMEPSSELPSVGRDKSEWALMSSISLPRELARPVLAADGMDLVLRLTLLMLLLGPVGNWTVRCLVLLLGGAGLVFPVMQLMRKHLKEGPRFCERIQPKKGRKQ